MSTRAGVKYVFLFVFKDANVCICIYICIWKPTRWNICICIWSDVKLELVKVQGVKFNKQDIRFHTKMFLILFMKSESHIMTQRATVGLTGPARSLSVPLGLLVDNQMVLHSMKTYTCHPGLCAIKRLNWSAIVTRNILMQLIQHLLASNGQTWALEAYVAFVYEICKINFDPHSFVRISFGLVFIKVSMISNIHLITTNMQMWKDLGRPFVWG